MLVIISPSKTLDFNDNNFSTQLNCAVPKYEKESLELVKELKKLSPQQISKLMDISEKLSALNFDRFNNFSEQKSKPALCAYKGDVYQGFELEKYDSKDFEFANSHLRIISGLYGILKPLDLIKPYRLEMSINLPNSKGKNLYDFWQDKITEHLNNENQELIVNLASNEYSSVIKRSKLNKKVIDVVFKEMHKGVLKIIGIQAKKARGMMANFIIQNKITNIKDLKKFSPYKFNESLSSEEEYVFTR